jgi:phospholipid/cholesterol/gamma-HCH transport system substrate-binding protein
MESRVAYTLVGLFVILLGAALVFAVLWLAFGAQTQTFDFYRVHVRESVAGLNPKAAVRYRGVDVGQVETIQLDPDDPRRVILTLRIARDTPIREDTVATLNIQGITGLATVELSGGSPTSPALEPKPGEPYPVIRSTPSLVQRLDDAFNQVLAAFGRVSEDVENLLSPTNRAAFSELLVNVSRLSGVLAERGDDLGRTLANLEAITGTLAAHGGDIDKALVAIVATLENSAQASAGLNTLIARLSDSITTVEAMALSITETSRNLDRVVLDSQRDLQQVVRRTTPELNALLLELSRLTDTVQRFVRNLERNPQMLLFGQPSARPGPGEN